MFEVAISFSAVRAQGGGKPSQVSAFSEGLAKHQLGHQSLGYLP